MLDRLASRFAGSRMNVALADADGAVLQRRFGEASMVRQLPAIQSVPGFVFAEQYGGTNGIGLALAERRLVHIFGAEHFAERAQSNACTATPVRDPLSGRIEGVLCFGYPRTYADPQLEILIRKAATAIERRLLAQSSARSAPCCARTSTPGSTRRPARRPGTGAWSGWTSCPEAGWTGATRCCSNRSPPS